MFRRFGKNGHIELQTSENNLVVSVSIGAIIDDIHSDLLTLQHNAELALIEAKQHGHGSVYLLDNSDKNRIRETADIASQLIHAIDHNELYLVFQPKVDLSTMQPVSAECLVRWQNASGQLISPGQFIPIAEDANLIGKIDEWVLNEAYKTIQSWKQTTNQIMPVAINVSAQQFHEPYFIDSVKKALDLYQIEPELIEIEITEYSLIEDNTLAENQIQSLYEMGVSVSVDDFGTGQSNLATLLELPINHIKIDQSFIKYGLKSTKGMKILESIVQLGASLGIKMTAEGVETQEQLNCVMKFGCHQVQGYFFSKPLNSDDYLTYINSFSK